MQINTVNEQDAYDAGFADAKDYWVPMELERIIKLLESDPEELIAAGGGLRAGYETAIELIKGEEK